MIYKGQIINVEKDYAIVFTNTAEYVKVVRKDGLQIGGQILFVEEDMIKEKHFKTKHLIMWASIIVLILLAATQTYQLPFFNHNYSMAVAVVSVDINPSIEIEVNQVRKVIGLKAVNEEGKAILTKDILNRDVSEVISNILNNAKDKAYLSEESKTILISITDLKKQEEFNPKDLQRIINEEIMKIQAVEVVYIEGNNRNIETAQAYNISIGKLELFKEMKELDKTITLEEVRRARVEDILYRRKQCQQRNQYGITIEPDENDIKEEIEENLNDNKQRWMEENRKRYQNHNDQESQPKGDGRHQYQKGTGHGKKINKGVENNTIQQKDSEDKRQQNYKGDNSQDIKSLCLDNKDQWYEEPYSKGDVQCLTHLASKLDSDRQVIKRKGKPCGG